MREQLLGYLLGALDGPERESVETQLERDSGLRQHIERLDAGLDPLRMDPDQVDPPDGLAAQTCEYVAAQAEAGAVTRAPASEVSPVREANSWAANWSLADLVAASSVIAATALMFFPAISNSRFQAHLGSCQNNLRQLGVALSQYSIAHNSYVPYVPPRGNLAAAGVYAPLLVEGGFVTDVQRFICPAGPLPEPGDVFRVPTMKEMTTARGATLAVLKRTCGGSYGYTLGYIDDGRHRGTRNRGRADYALMSDAPSHHLAGRQSSNHGGRGQNVLFENGRVQFLVTCRVGACDDVFVSERGYVEAGAHRDDAVVGHSAAVPMPWIVGPAGP